MAKKPGWKIVAKNGDIDYSYGGNKKVDYVEEFGDFQAALENFLVWVSDFGGNTPGKVSLVYTPPKRAE